jgi:hypothetical protein
MRYPTGTVTFLFSYMEGSTNIGRHTWIAKRYIDQEATKGIGESLIVSSGDLLYDRYPSFVKGISPPGAKLYKYQY